MTKKDYILIASAINELYLGHKDWSRKLEQVVKKFAEVLSEENPRFNRDKFLEACGLFEEEL